MAVEDKVRSAGTKGITYPWMRRYVLFRLVDGSVRRTIVTIVAGRGVHRAAQSASSRRRKRSAGSKDTNA